MRFTFDEGKAGEAAAYLLKWGGGRMGRLKLIKLLYLADRRSLVETGFPITGDRVYAMKKGPVLSATLDRISGKVRGTGGVTRYAVPESGDEGVRLANDPPAEAAELSRYEMRILAGVHQEFGGYTGEGLVDYLHRKAHEWRVPAHSKSRSLIEPADILRAAGKSPEEIEAMAAEAAYYYTAERSIASA